MIRRRFTSESYMRLYDIGVLDESERVELINGDIEVMSPMGFRHVCIVDRLNDLLTELLRRKAIVSIQSTARISDYSMPEPDVTVKNYRSDFYATRRPTVDEMPLFIEVADTTVEYDRDTKIPLYGRSGIRESWLVDLNSNVVMRYTNPTRDGYATPEEFRPGDVLTSSIAGVEVKIDVAALLA